MHSESNDTDYFCRIEKNEFYLKNKLNKNVNQYVYYNSFYIHKYKAFC